MDYSGVAASLWTDCGGGIMFACQRTLRADETWLLFVVPFLVVVALTVLLLRFVPILERNLERWVLIAVYLTMAGIIFAGVIQRFFLDGQPAWSTTLPKYLFLVLTWLAAAYSIKRRTQLNFNELRSIMPRGAQMAMLVLDWLLWTGFAYIVVVTTLRRTVSSQANFQVLPGTDDVMQWWFYAAVPACWVLLAARAWITLTQDRANYREGRDLVGTVSVTETE